MKANSKGNRALKSKDRQCTVLLTLFLCLLIPPLTFAQHGNSTKKPEMKRVPVQGGELEYEVRGQGEPVLLIHGGVIAEAWLPVMDEPALSNYRLICYHRRGYAGSTAPAAASIRQHAADAITLLHYLEIERAHIVGHSGGGVFALQMFLDAPGMVHSLSLLEPSLTMVPGASEFAKATMAPMWNNYNAGNPIEALDIFMRGVGGNNWRTEVARTVPGGPEQAEQDAETFFEENRMPADGPWQFDEKKAENTSQPVLFMWGSETLPFLKNGRDLVHKWFPQTEDYRVQGVNHSMQMIDPQSVAEGIADFLKRHPM